MKQPGQLLEHGGETYLLVEGGYNDDTRTVVLLGRPDNASFPHDGHTVPVVWRDQGEWFPLARWALGGITVQESEHEQQQELLIEIFERYLEEASQPPECAWAVVGESGEFEASLERILPMGLAVSIHDSLEAAEDAAEGAQIVPIRNVAQFLMHLTREGYAGAMWNGELPVFFCIDELGELQFLRIRRGDSGGVEMDILDPIAGWEPYEGAEEIEFLDNRDACDARLVAALGSVPVLGWPGPDRLWTAGPERGRPGLARRDEDGVTYGLLFTGEGQANSWLEELDEPWCAWPVDDLRAWLLLPELASCGGGILNPGDHRARSGVLWTDGSRIVLDTFSGFWRLAGDAFEKAD